jgi:hypothetical protein
VLAILLNEEWPENDSSKVPAAFCCCRAILLNKEWPEIDSSEVPASIVCHISSKVPAPNMLSS